jgi:LacI family transcriptional regulator, repressor for deo operon, udp, cdd, tsx, nupC, and nupG
VGSRGWTAAAAFTPGAGNHIKIAAVANIFDVAKRAGVSIATVSRVLSRPDAVASATRRRVMQAVTYLGYTTNAAGKHLRTQKSDKILVTIPDISNPFYSRVLQSIEESAQREGYSVLLADTQHDLKREERYTLMLRRRDAEGLIVLGDGLPDVALEVSRETSGIAHIVGACEFNSRANIPRVHIDNHAAARDALEHLYSLGHRRIGLIAGPSDSALSRDRLEGATARARVQRAEKDLVVARGDFTLESGEKAAVQLLARADRPTAIFCFNDQMAIGAMDILRRRGLVVPDDVSVVGFDDISFARYTVPALTTIAQPVREIGQETVRLLLGIVRGQTPSAVSVILPHRLVVRDSTAPLAGTKRGRRVQMEEPVSRR